MNLILNIFFSLSLVRLCSASSYFYSAKRTNFKPETLSTMGNAIIILMLKFKSINFTKSIKLQLNFRI